MLITFLIQMVRNPRFDLVSENDIFLNYSSFKSILLNIMFHALMGRFHDKHQLQQILYRKNQQKLQHKI